MGIEEELVKIAAEEILQGIEDDVEPEEIADKAIKKMEDIIAEIEKKEEESKEFELSLKGKAGDVLSERTVIKGNSRAIARAMKKLLHATALRLGKYDPIQAAVIVNAITLEVSGSLLKKEKK